MKMYFNGLLIVMLNLSCGQRPAVTIHGKQPPDNFPFKIESPDKRYELPDQLREISGISALNDSVVACIGDEKGIIYFYDLKKEIIQAKLHFSRKGDFEDLTIIGDTIYVLDSKGVLWVIKNFATNAEINSFTLPVAPPFEMEGLCHWGDTLFIAAKYYHNNKRDSPGILPVWKLAPPELKSTTILFLLPDLVLLTAGKQLPFHTSAILYNEIANEWYCLSTHTKIILRCDYLGNILSVKALPAVEFPQPEGICLMPSGDLLIANEGRTGRGSILLFHPKKMKP